MTKQRIATPEPAFAHIGNAALMESLYERYRADHASVDESWQIFFQGYEMAMFAGGERRSHRCQVCARVRLGSEVQSYISLFRRLGHLCADVNPLCPKPPLIPELQIKDTPLAEVDPAETFQPAQLPFKGPVRFAEIDDLLTDTYTRSIGADFMDSTTIEEVRWLEQMMEECRNKPVLTPLRQHEILKQLIHAQGFERFLHDRYIGMKRFSLEGLESLIPLLATIIDEGASRDVAEICLGMAHRGRLNVLAGIMEKPLETMFFEFEDTELHQSIDGDVHFHKGYAASVATSTHPVDLYLAPNPSHLEAVDAVITGFARARANSRGTSLAVLPLLIHGDAAIIGQGIVAETLNLAALHHYQTGGTIHIITNNQIGFTTTAEESRSFNYASDIAKIIRAPVFHVNADDPEAVVWTGVMAAAYRQLFHKDIVIDLIGYRKYGHNETDEPSFTQPLMYQAIRTHQPVMEIYLAQLLSANIIAKADADSQKAAYREKLGKAYDYVKSGGPPLPFTPPAGFSAIFRYQPTELDQMFAPVETEVSVTKLLALGQRITSLPLGFQPHPKMEKLLAARGAMLENKGALDWAMGELLAYASLAAQGHPVRLSGQDCARGTFSHRHACLHDQSTGVTYEPLSRIDEGWAAVDIINSPLSEQAVLGFEFGYAVASPEALVIWEAQFGDFCNGAQIIIDQFLAASEAKWQQTSGLVLYLPHGFEGQGPEHSSARPERFLMLCGQGNMQIANLTTPSQLFHILRRQVLRPFRKPLVIFTPKSLLRHPDALSPLSAFTADRFHEVLPEVEPHDSAEIEEIIFCTGKIYYELIKARRQQSGPFKKAVVRIEQLYPFPRHNLEEILQSYPHVKQILWVQEEPRNHGYWWFVHSQFGKMATFSTPIRFIGRPSAGTTAEGSRSNHIKEQERIIRNALA